MVKTPAAFAITPPLLLRPPVAVGLGELDVAVKLEARELMELRTEEREEREEERPELLDEDDVLVDVDDKLVRDDDSDECGGSDTETEMLRVETGGEVDVREGRGGMEVGLSTQTPLVPLPTVIGGVTLPSPTASLSTITTLVPAGIVTAGQVNEVPVTSVKAARTAPSGPSEWKERLNGGSPVLVSYSMTKGSQVVMLGGGKTWNALTAETKRARAENTTNFMTGA